MRESTGKWLEPLETAAKEFDLDTDEFMRQASMPVCESPAKDSLLAKWMTEAEDRGEMGNMSFAGIDWIRYGQLLRDALGWEDYPEAPEEE